MEKQYKPVPDVEALRYKGTPDKPDIKIFVSHRIDLDSETVDNPLYIPVRCGAVYDERENVTMLGDDTGDNISEKRKTFCELTVLYWAWKNVQADYYGLCHYRRYLSFSIDQYEVKKYVYSWGCVHEEFLTDKTVEKYNLKQDALQDEIAKYDIVMATPCKLDETDGPWENNREYIQAHLNSFNADDIGLVREIVMEQSPELVQYFDEYFDCGYANWYNCFVIKRDIFNSFCEWMFPILFEFEKRCKSDNYSRNMSREPGFFGEHLWGTYLRYIKDKCNYKIAEKQLIFFKQTDKQSTGKLQSENTIPIVFCCSEWYVPYLATTIQSIIDYASNNKQYSIVILESGLSEVSRRRLAAIFNEKDNFELIFYNPYLITSEIKFHVVPGGTKESYYKLFTPWILKEFDKAIILDCDTIVKCDLAELYEYEIGKNWIAAAKDIVFQGRLSVARDHILDYYVNRLNLDIHNIINSGVLVMNLERLRKDVAIDELAGFCETLPFVNQETDIFNSFMRGKISYLNLKWNFVPKSSYQMHFDMLCGPLKLVEEYEDAVDHIKIMHYFGGIKPWSVPHIEYGDWFWTTAKETIYYEIIIQRMVNVQISNNTHQLFSCATTGQEQQYVSGARRVANKLLPIGSRRREILKFFIPKGSKLWNFLKRIYYLGDRCTKKEKPIIIG